MLKWEKLSLRRKKQKALILYKTLNELAPDYLQCLVTQRHVNDSLFRALGCWGRAKASGRKNEGGLSRGTG